MKRIIVADQNQIVMEETLEAAPERLFPSGERKPAGAAPGCPCRGADRGRLGELLERMKGRR